MFWARHGMMMSIDDDAADNDGGDDDVDVNVRRHVISLPCVVDPLM